MPKRKFELPSIQDLSKEQEGVRALPKKGQHLIVGGPGTGKSVIALLRARRHHKNGESYYFLVFNHLLSRACGQLFGDEFVGRTWITWFLATFNDSLGHPVPRKPPNPNGYREIDWSRTVEMALSLPVKNQGNPYLVIDEGQDMPPEFYQTLVQLGYDRFFVVADQNQQITNANSSLKEIQDCLAIDSNKVIDLRYNYRNRYRIAKFASEFYTGDPASNPPELPVKGPGPTPTLITYDGEMLQKVAQEILLLADRDPRKLIGIITPNNSVRIRYLDALQAADLQLDNGPPTVNTFHSNNRSEIAFDEGGIIVINAQSCKGLEFDIVVLADIDEHYFRGSDPDNSKRLFYVMASRAIERVFMTSKRNGRNNIDSILPPISDHFRREHLR